MKRSEVAAQMSSSAGPMQRDMHFVYQDGPSVRVRLYVVENDRGVRHVAELSIHDGRIERALIDAASSQELGEMIEPAARAFALSTGLRSRSRGPRP
jgi:hypothetical protein